MDENFDLEDELQRELEAGMEVDEGACGLNFFLASSLHSCSSCTNVSLTCLYY
jgi:hypothetical protein